MEISGYKIQKKIGQGGMATVYLAIQESLHRPVVLKILDTARIESEQWTERFLTEGRLVASLHHPYIITIYDIGLSDDQLFISMEYIEGGDLKLRMELPILPDTCLDYMIKIGEALEAAHQHGIVHRDVKPANILFRDDATPLLTDFGIAKQMDGDMDLTSTGIFLGSPNYVSPEQADGLAVDGRSDIYSMGCILYEMLTGEKPFSSESVVEIVIKHKQSPIPQLPEEYALFQPLLERMMAKRREDRFRDCRNMIEFMKEIRQSYQRNTVGSEYDLTVAEKIEEPVKTIAAKKNYNTLLMVFLVIGLLLNVGLHIAEKYIIGGSSFQVDSSMQARLPKPVIPNITTTNNGGKTSSQQTLNTETASPAVMKALLWLGKQSLEEFKLTYPPKDNAFYYFNKLLEVDKNNQEAKEGILNIAERYAVLSEQAVADGDYEKAKSYIQVGLQIDKNNTALLSIRDLIDELDNPSFLDALMAIFSSK